MAKRTWDGVVEQEADEAPYEHGSLEEHIENVVQRGIAWVVSGKITHECNGI